MATVFTIGGNTVSYGEFLLRELGKGSLTISKTVTGTGFDPAKTFELTVTFDKAVTYNGTTSTTHTFNLASGQSVTITDIPENTHYDVVETPLSQADIEAGYSIDTMSGGTGTVAANGSYAAAAVNGFGAGAKSMTFQFSDASYNPSQSYSLPAGRYPPASSNYTWEQVSASPNVWRYTTDETDWDRLFSASCFGGSIQSMPTGDITVLDANLAGVTDLTRLFTGNIALVEVRTLRNASGVLRTTEMFNGCTTLRSVALFDTSAVTRMDYMFYGCEAIESVPLFDTSSVANMERMFWGCHSLASVPLFDTSAVTNMAYMFHECTSLVSVPLFDTSAVTDMRYMFHRCYALASCPVFDTSSVTNMGGMFSMCGALEYAPAFDTSSVTNMSAMFGGATTYTPGLKAVPAYDIGSVTDVEGMFAYCRKVESGAYALYSRLAALSPQPSHEHCFQYCGADTTPGSADLARIPSDWK